MSIPTQTALPEPLMHTQSWLMTYCPYTLQNGYNRWALWRLALEGHREEISDLFRYIIAHASSACDREYVWFLRGICRFDSGLLVELSEECFRVLDRRAVTNPHGHRRNPAFERLLVEEMMSDDVLRYMQYVTQPSYALLRVLAVKYRREADAIALRGLPNGTLVGPRILADNKSAYNHIAWCTSSVRTTVQS
ncbi:hypothetical protein JS531_00060 [Bifidobacterium sp. CP2]|uniref:hypothetical protein n=1 Tax=Bifidobacterium sp. CP2 TaxID=2809025 RepID=UPI001BDDBCDF|nr:hypothetical protein [Bifidobacterium sp. CP2]MBT1180398.1 hypothetical protein [Bifidobacterium sp. CP2]